MPVYLRPAIREWLAGNDVPLPRKPVKKKAVKKGAKKATKKATKKVTKKASHPHVAERHATHGERRKRAAR